MSGLRSAAPDIPLQAWCRAGTLRHAAPPARQPEDGPLPDNAAAAPPCGVPARGRLTRDLTLGCAWLAARSIQGLRRLGVLRPCHVSRLVPVILRMADAANRSPGNV